VDNRNSKLEEVSDFIKENPSSLSFINSISSENMFQHTREVKIPELESSDETIPEFTNEKRVTPFNGELFSLDALTSSIEKINKRLDSINNTEVVNNFITNEKYDNIRNMREADKNYSTREYSPSFTKEDISKSVNLFVDTPVDIPEIKTKDYDNSNVESVENSFIAFERSLNSNTLNDISNDIFNNEKHSPVSFSNNTNENRVSNILNENQEYRKEFYKENVDRSVSSVKNISNMDRITTAKTSFNNFENKNTKVLNQNDANVNYAPLTTYSDTDFSTSAAPIYNDSVSSESPTNNKTFITNVIKVPKKDIDKIINNEAKEEYTFFAEGGYVDRATKAIVGEAGPEIVTPLDKVPQILAEANTIEKANGNLSKNATMSAVENQSIKTEASATKQEGPQSMLPLPIITPPNPKADSPNSMGSASSTSRINDALRETHTIPTWRQKLG